MSDTQLVKTVNGPTSLLERDMQGLMEAFVGGGEHPFEDDTWLALFRFQNGFQASVVQGPFTRGIEIGVMMHDIALVEVLDCLSGDEVIPALFEIMERTVV